MWLSMLEFQVIQFLFDNNWRQNILTSVLVYHHVSPSVWRRRSSRDNVGCPVCAFLASSTLDFNCLFAAAKEPFIECLLQYGAKIRHLTSWRCGALVRITSSSPAFNATVERAHCAFPGLFREHRRHRLHLQQIVEYVGNITWRCANSGAILLFNWLAVTVERKCLFFYVEVYFISEHSSVLNWV